MAVVSLDDDTPPRFFDHWERIAEAIGSLPDRGDYPTQDAYLKATASAQRQIEKAIQSLAEAGAITYSGQARKGIKAEYALALDPSIGWVCKGMRLDQKDGRLKGVWEPVDRDSARPKKSEIARPKKSPKPDQKSREVPTKKVGPMITQEPPQEQGSGARSPQVVKSPALDLAEPIEQKPMAEEMTCSTCLRRRYRDEMTRTGVGAWICAGCAKATAAKEKAS